MSEILVVPHVGTAPAIGITELGRQEKREMLALSQEIKAITSVAVRDGAINVASAIKAHLKEVEASRQEVLKPFHQTVALINTAARDHVAELDRELKRLNGIVGEFEVNRQKQEFLARQTATNESAPLADRLEAEEKMDQAAAPKPTGGALRKDWDITVTDPHALYAAHRQCVKLEPQLLAIKDLLKAGITPPGVTATPKAAYAARAKR